MPDRDMGLGEMDRQFEALKSISRDVTLNMRKPRDWWVHLSGVEIGGDGMLRTSSADGATPQEAVRNAWQRITRLEPGQYLVLNAAGPNRRQVRWNGFMWADVTE